ncbi:MAG TPA: ATP-binding protein [Candidatus Acidoferrum sp.]
MKMAARRTTKQEPSFENDYRSALSEYAARSGEAGLGRAYELGRKAMTEGKSLVELVAIHHRALQGIAREAGKGKGDGGLLRASADFLTESLSPYEMAHRGFQDAVKALRQFNETLEEEIKRIAYAVHDEAGQALVAVHLALASLAAELPDKQQQIRDLEGLLNQVEQQLRRYSHELRPTVLDDLGWIPAIRFLAKNVSTRAHIPIQVTAAFAGRLPDAMETALYRIVQEALTNASKHAKATRIWIQVRRRQDGTLCCSVRDDGVGFDLSVVHAAGKRKGLGLIGIQERLNAIGGTLSINSAPGRGTTLMIRLPLEDSNSDSGPSRR